MKTAFELAMERLNQASGPVRKLTDAQKKRLADLDAQYRAKVAERELAIQDELAAASTRDEPEKVAQLEQRLIQERQSLLAELEKKKEQVRAEAA